MPTECSKFVVHIPCGKPQGVKFKYVNFEWVYRI